MLVTELEIKDKDKGGQVICHWRKMCRCTALHILNHCARLGSVTNCLAWPLYLLKQNWQPLYLGRIGLGISLDDSSKCLSPHLISNPAPSIPYRFAVPTTLLWSPVLRLPEHFGIYGNKNNVNNILAILHALSLLKLVPRVKLGVITLHLSF